MYKRLAKITFFSLLLFFSTMQAMEQDILRRAEGGLQAGTINLLFPNATLHGHVQGEQLTINQFNQEHYNRRVPFFTQAKESFLSGWLQSSFDFSNLPGYFGKVLAAAAAQAAFSLVINKIPAFIYNHIFRSSETAKRKKEAEAQVALQQIAAENMLLSNIHSQMQQMSSEQKKEAREVEKKLFEAHIRRVGRYTKNYGSV